MRPDHEPDPKPVRAVRRVVAGALLCALAGAAALAAAIVTEASTPALAVSATLLVLAAGASAWAYRAHASERAPRATLAGSPAAAGDTGEAGALPLTEELASERAASKDLLALDRAIRSYYLLPVAAGRLEIEPATLFTPDARLELRDVDPRVDTGSTGVGAGEMLDALCRRTGAPGCLERSRTVHVVGDVAVVISAFAASGSAAAVRGVNVIELRRAGEVWRIRSIVAQPIQRFVTEQSATPRRRRGTAPA